MTRASFLLMVPILSSLIKDKVIDFKHEYNLRSFLFDQCPIEKSKVFPMEMRFSNTIQFDMYMNHWWRVFVLEHVYGIPQDPINDTDYVIPQHIMDGSTKITERQFKRDSKGWF